MAYTVSLQNHLHVFSSGNAINNGILLLECPDLPDDVNEGDTVKVELDKQQISANGKTYKIPAIPENQYHIIMDGGLVKEH